MRDPDAPIGNPHESDPAPPLPDKAKEFERKLHGAFAVKHERIHDLWLEWQAAEGQLRSLATDVNRARTDLETPDTGAGWTGPAATSAYKSMRTLRKGLLDRADEIADVTTSIFDMHVAVGAARSAYNNDVLGVKKGQMNMGMSTEERESIDDSYWEGRNQAAKKAFEQLNLDARTATAKMPLQAKSSSETPYSDQGPAASNHTPGTATNSGTGGYPTATVVGPGRPDITINPVRPDDDGGLNPVIPGEDPTITPIEGPGLTPGTYDPISSDGDVGGTTGLTPGGGSTGSGGGSPSGGGMGGVGAGGVAAGGVGGVAGLGGLLGKRGSSMFSSGGSARGGSTSARGTGSGAGTRGSALRPGGARTGGAQMVPGGGGTRSGGATRGGGAGGRGSAVKGSTGSGKYGVPKVGGKGTGGVPVGGAGQAGKGAGKAGGRGSGASGAAGRGGARKGDKNQPQDIDKLTHEDEEIWFDGTEDSSPQVWE